MTIGREVKLFISSLVLIALGVVLIIQYTDLCNLQAVTLNGQPVDSWDHSLGLRPGAPVIRQPIDSVANAILSQQGITHVDIQYRLPSMLMISTNNLEPVCYVLDRVTGIYFGLDESGRVVPIDISQSKWELPIFTGLRVRRMHDYTDDYRVNLVLPQVLQIKKANPSFYAFVEEVDFSHSNYVGLGLEGRGFRLRLPADRFGERLDEFNKFVDRYHPPLDSTSSFDLSYDDVIIRVGAVFSKKKTVIDTEIADDKSDFSDETDLEPVVMDIPSRTVAPAESSLTVATPEVNPGVTPPVVDKKLTAKDESVVTSSSAVKSPAKPVVTAPQTSSRQAATKTPTKGAVAAKSDTAKSKLTPAPSTTSKKAPAVHRSTPKRKKTSVTKSSGSVKRTGTTAASGNSKPTLSHKTKNPQVPKQ
jgi:hypothetical protein